MSWDRKVRDNKKHHEVEITDARKANKKPKKNRPFIDDDHEMEKLVTKFNNYDFGVR
ncbi:MAG: hypothetical protein WC679_00385 [Bacteroidales bacterium]|jgi:hypothetical protein